MKPLYTMAEPPRGTLGNYRIALAVSLLTGLIIGGIGAKLHSRVAWQRAAAATCHDVPCPHYSVRLAAIESAIGQQGSVPSYLIIGDSLTELAGEMPIVCGRHPINAGIGRATVDTFADGTANRLAELARPDWIVVALGTNDALLGRGGRLGASMAGLLKSLSRWRVIVVPVPAGPAVSAAADVKGINAMLRTISERTASTLVAPVTLPDGIHRAPAGYPDWKKAIVDASEAWVCNSPVPTSG